MAKDEKVILPGFKVDIVKGPAPERVGSAAASTRANKLAGTSSTGPPPALQVSGPNKEGLNKVQAALEKINAELAAKKKAMASAAAAYPQTTDPKGQGQVSTERKPKDPDATDFHAVVQINDFVQKARWMVTNRESYVICSHSSPEVTEPTVFLFLWVETG